jgi:hypothetical protein
MKEKFIDFMTSPGLETFLAVRESIVADAGYDPYSDDLEMLDNLFVAEEYEKIADHKDVNILLSPLAHLIKSVAYEKMEREEESQSEMYMWHTLVKSILLTGDGTMEKPYLVTRISDERDLLEHLQEVFTSQRLTHQGTQHLDCISTASGKDIYFDITECYKRMAGITNEQPATETEVLPPVKEEAEPEEKTESPVITTVKEPLVINEEEDFREEEDEVFVEKKKWWKFW